MKTWPIRDAKARFSELVEACIAEGPQMVTKRGTEAAVLVPVGQWRRLQSVARPTLKRLLLLGDARIKGLTPARPAVRRRKAVQTFEAWSERARTLNRPQAEKLSDDGINRLVHALR